MLLIVLSGFIYGSYAGTAMNRAVIDLTAAVVDDGRLSIDAYRENTEDVTIHDGRTYSGMAPGVSFLAVPVYGAAKVMLAVTPGAIHRYLDWRAARHDPPTPVFAGPHFKERLVTHILMALLFGAVAGALSFLIVSRITIELVGDARIAEWTGLVYSFGTVIVYYNATILTQPVALFLLLASVYFLFLRPKSLLNAGVGALLAGIAGSCDYPFFVYGGLTVLFAFVRCGHVKAGARFIIAFAAAFAAPLLLTMLYQAAAFGSPFATPYGLRPSPEGYTEGVLGLGLGLPSWERLKSLLWSVEEGVLVLMPFCVLAPAGAWHLCRRWWRRPGADGRPAAQEDATPKLLLILMFSLIGTSGLFFVCVPWVSDMGSYGPRFFLPGVVFLTIFSYPYLPRTRWVFVPLFAYSVAINRVNLIRIEPLVRLEEWIKTGAVEMRPVKIPIAAWRLPWFQGLCFDLAYLAVLIGLIFGLPWLVRRLRRRRAPLIVQPEPS